MFIAAGVISQNVTRTFEKTRIEKMVFCGFLWFLGHKILVLHGIELKIAKNM